MSPKVVNIPTAAMGEYANEASRIRAESNIAVVGPRIRNALIRSYVTQSKTFYSGGLNHASVMSFASNIYEIKSAEQITGLPSVYKIGQGVLHYISLGVLNPEDPMKLMCQAEHRHRDRINRAFKWAVDMLVTRKFNNVPRVLPNWSNSPANELLPSEMELVGELYGWIPKSQRTGSQTILPEYGPNVAYNGTVAALNHVLSKLHNSH